jgi:murein L,D-transpeptidase YafK
MRRLRHLLWVGVLAATIAVAVVGWDFLKLDREPPTTMPDTRATMVIVDKAVRRLTLLRDGTTLKTYDVSLGPSPTGHKQREGDGRTPEGVYKIDFKHPRSRFHLSLRVSYPNTEDRENAHRRGVPPGGDIMIHGLPNGLGWLGRFHLTRDWTDGCIAVTNREIEEIWALVDVGTDIQIRP